jgi:general secretion pathway protein K
MKHQAESQLHSHRSRRRRRGVALIMVLGALSILTVMLTEFQDETAAEFGSALSDRDALKAEYAARSAVNLSRLLIAAEPTIRKPLEPMMMLLLRASTQIPVWAHASKVLGAFNDEAGVNSFAQMAGFSAGDAKNLGLPGASFELEIVDEDSKINVNVPAKGSAFAQQRLAMQLMGLMMGPQYDPLFDSRDERGNINDRQTICSAVVDWTDPDQDLFPCDMQTNTAQSAASEDSFYQQLKKPYERKNAAFDSLEELHLVRGMSQDFWSTFVDPKDDPKSRVLTVWGTGQVNVNTASSMTNLANVLANAVPGSPITTDPAEQQKFLRAMTLAEMIPGVPKFGSPKAFIGMLQGSNKSPLAAMLQEALQLKPIEFQAANEFEKSLSTESKVFSIYATGKVVAGKRETRTRIHAVVDFRAAPAPGIDPRLQALLEQSGQGTANPGGPNQGTGGAQGTGGSGSANPNAIAGATEPSAGGNVVYYRVE